MFIQYNISSSITTQSFLGISLQPFLLQLQITRQLVIWISVGFLRGTLFALFDLIRFFLYGVEVRAEIEVFRHAEKLE
jgi:hypothetical protein